MRYIIFSLLIFVVFMVMLNDFLRGSKKAQIDAALSIMLIGLIATIFITYGWKMGLVAVVMSFVVAAVSRPLAAGVASRLFAMGSATQRHYPGFPPRALERISRQLEHSSDPSEMMRNILSGNDERLRAEEALIDYCERDENVRRVIDEFGISREELRDLYSELLLYGAGQWACGHWVAASALVYPHTLKYLLESKAGGQSGEEIAFTLIMHFLRGAPLENY